MFEQQCFPVAYLLHDNKPHLLYTIVSTSLDYYVVKIERKAESQQSPGVETTWLESPVTLPLSYDHYHPNISLYVLHRWYWRLQLLFIFSTWHLGFQLWQGVSAALDVMHTVTHCTCGTVIQVFLYCLVLSGCWMWGRCHGCEADAIYVRQMPSMCIHSCPPTLFMCACDNPLCLHTRMVWWFNDLTPYRQNGLGLLDNTLPSPFFLVQSCISANTYTVCWYIVNS